MISVADKAELRQEFAKAALPAMISRAKIENYVDPDKMIAKLTWAIATALADMAIEQFEREMKEDAEEGADA